MMSPHNIRGAMSGLAWIFATLLLCACRATPTPSPISKPAPTTAPVPTTMYLCAQGNNVTLRVDSACQNSSSIGLADNTRLSVTRVDGGCATITMTDGAQGYIPAQYLCSAPSGVDWSKAGDYVGQVRTVCGPVIAATYGPDVKGRPVWLDLGENKPSPNRFQVGIWGLYEGHPAEPPENDYLGRLVCVSGTITRVGGITQMDVTNPWAIFVQ